MRSNNWRSVLTIDEIWKIRENIKPFSFNLLNNVRSVFAHFESFELFQVHDAAADGPLSDRSKFTVRNTKTIHFCSRGTGSVAHDVTLQPTDV